MANNYGANGTLTWEDIYGVGSLDTLTPANAAAANKTNPNDSGITGQVSSDKSSLFNMGGRKFLNQPIVVWLGLIVMLVVLKFGVEGKASKKLKSVGI